ncbi:hypothetical protein E4U21_003701 [Claviceps maximensis]|nr:hypothetical protein E4U21_003701 [Claviceps maximensis]
MEHTAPSITSRTPRTPKGQFPPPIIIPPLHQPHQHTVIFLHGRGSHAAKFHGPLLETRLDDNQTFRDALPATRFVFPTAPRSRATRYARMLIHQWFDGSGDWEELAAARGGMRPSMDYIRRLIRHEILLLGGRARRLVLAGISQGCATALMSVLLWDGEPLGAVVGLCGYMPICSYLVGVFDGASPVQQGHADDDDDGHDVFERDEDPSPTSPARSVLDALQDEAELPGGDAESRRRGLASLASTPVFLGHGTSDPQVPLSQAFLAEELLCKMGMVVELRTYDGLGHWYGREMLCHVVSFLERQLT